MEIPFKWLREQKVTNIVKVIVDDLEGPDTPPHSDDAIENALIGINVEILDWRKVDLCPQTICTACPSLREVHLWWSGTNGMLRAWSEPEGLPLLENLTTVHLHQIQVSR